MAILLVCTCVCLSLSPPISMYNNCPLSIAFCAEVEKDWKECERSREGRWAYPIKARALLGRLLPRQIPEAVVLGLYIVSRAVVEG